MLAILESDRWRKIGLVALLAGALLMLAVAVFVVVNDDPILRPDDAFPEPVIVDLDRQPGFVFPESVRTYDLSLNRFVDRFARVCMQAKYSDFRLMLSRRRPPILPPRFESNFNALQRIDILSIEKLPEIPSASGPVYIMKASYTLQDYAVKRGEKTKYIQLAITKEDGDWRIGPIPHDALARLREYEAGRQPPPADKPAAPPAPPRTTANRPARIGS